MSSQPPTPPAASSRLRSLVAALTGGREGCPRKRFFISLILAVFILKLSTRILVPCYAFCMFTLHADSALVWLDILLGLCYSVSAPLGITAFSLIDAIPLYGMPSIPLTIGESTSDGWLYALGFYLCAPLAIVAGLVVFTLACRRLRDAGYSRWNLLAGLIPLAWSAAEYLLGLNLVEYTGRWPGFFLYHLGAFWLLWLYSRPTRPTDSSVLRQIC